MATAQQPPPTRPPPAPPDTQTGKRVGAATGLTIGLLAVALGLWLLSPGAHLPTWRTTSSWTDEARRYDHGIFDGIVADAPARSQRPAARSRHASGPCPVAGRSPEKDAGAAPVTRYAAWVHREGDWLVITVPAIGELTDARRWEDVERNAHELVAFSLGVPCEDVEIAVRREL